MESSSPDKTGIRRHTMPPHSTKNIKNTHFQATLNLQQMINLKSGAGKSSATYIRPSSGK